MKTPKPKKKSARDQAREDFPYSKTDVIRHVGKHPLALATFLGEPDYTSPSGRETRFSNLPDLHQHVGIFSGEELHSLTIGKIGRHAFSSLKLIGIGSLPDCRKALAEYPSEYSKRKLDRSPRAISRLVADELFKKHNIKF